MTRRHLQVFIGHSDKRRISAWLKDLREKEYIAWIYDPNDFYAKTRPAVYYLGINGIRHYLAQSDIYPSEEVRKRYRESSRSQTYIDRCLLIADCCAELRLVRDDKPDTWYGYDSEADYRKEGSFDFLQDSDLIHPHLCIAKYFWQGGEPEVVETYFMEVFDPNYPRYRMTKRLKDYVEYLDDKQWEGETGNDQAPIILFVCPRISDLIYAKRRTRGIYGSQYIQDKDTPKDERLHIRFTTSEKLKDHGLMGDIWEEA